MDRLIYTALTGLGARQRAQAVTANNLANAGTTGFRRELVAAEGRYLVGEAGQGSRAQAGAPSLATPRDPGKVDPTGRALDVAMAGTAWLAVQGPVVNGEPTEAYTRRGDLAVAPSGVVQNGDGRAVLGTNGAPLTVPLGAALDIASDGTLSARVGEVATPIGRLKLVDGSSLDGRDKAGNGLFAPREPLLADPDARLATGVLESANVNAAGALAELVEESRGFDVNARLLGIARDMDERSARLMALNGEA